MFIALEVLCVLTIIALVIVGAVYYIGEGRYRFEHAYKPKRDLILGEDGELVAVGQHRRSAEINLRGNGTFASDTFDLLPGMYKLEYTFPPSEIIKVDLINVQNADTETIAMKSGTGSLAFAVESGGRYLFQIEPSTESAAWALMCRPLG